MELFDKWKSQVTGSWKIPKSLTLSLELQEYNRFYYFCLEERYLGTEVSFVHYTPSVGIAESNTISIGSEYPLHAVLRPDNRYVMSNRLTLYIVELETIEDVFIAAEQIASRLQVDISLCTHSQGVHLDLPSVLKRYIDTSNKLHRLLFKILPTRHNNNNHKECLHALISYRTRELVTYLRLINLLSDNVFPAPIQFHVAFHAPNYSDLVSAIGELRKDPRTFDAEMKPFEFVLSHAKDWDIYKDAWSVYECNHDLGQQGSR